MNYNNNWPYRGVQHHPYPPSAPSTQNTAGGTATPTVPYPPAHPPNASTSYTASNAYHAPAYNSASTTYNANASASYGGAAGYGQSSHSTGATYTSPHPSYAPAVPQRQHSAAEQQQQHHQQQQTQQTRSTVSGTAPVAASNNTSYTRTPSVPTPSQASTTTQKTATRQEDQQPTQSTKPSYQPPPSQQQVVAPTPATTAPAPKSATPSSTHHHHQQASLHTSIPAGATPAPKRKSMGRLGDADVHQAFVEFRAKETDKCLSAQCIYCQSVRAKNTSRQRQHLLECQNYLTAMREHNPNHPILDMAAQHAAGTPLKDIVKTAGTNGTPGLSGGSGGGGGGVGGGSGGAGGGPPPPPAIGPSPNGHAVTPTQSHKRVKTHHEREGVVVPVGGGSHGGGGFVGSSVAPGGAHSLPPPRLERDFQLAIQLNPKLDVGTGIWGQRSHWTSFISGHWNGRWGKGTVVPGGQDRQMTAEKDGSTYTKSQFLLQTHDHPTAFITVKMEGWRVGSKEVLEQLGDPSRIDSVDPRSYSHRCFISMETGDERYKDLNVGMWLGTVVRKATEVVYDAYRIS